jgi:hypothetical protein
MRLAALIVTVVGLMTFVAAQGASGRTGIVLVSVSLALFVLEVVFGIIEGRSTRYEE